MSEYDYRFGGIGRLYGNAVQEKLKLAHIAIIGIGGVGTWAAEALVRSGIGKITLVDLDDVCITNVNRQVHALEGQIGVLKTEAMKNRLKLINPECEVHCIEDFFTEKTANDILSHDYDFVIDCIDNYQTKLHLLLMCKQRHIPLIVCGGAAGKQDPSQIEISDLGQVVNDPLLKKMKKVLRQKHSYPRKGRGAFKIDAVFSKEKQFHPTSDGGVCKKREPGSLTKLDCQNGMGSASFVTGSIGFFAASIVVKKLTLDS